MWMHLALLLLALNLFVFYRGPLKQAWALAPAQTEA